MEGVRKTEREGKRENMEIHISYTAAYIDHMN